MSAKREREARRRERLERERAGAKRAGRRRTFRWLGAAALAVVAVGAVAAVAASGGSGSSPSIATNAPASAPSQGQPGHVPAAVARNIAQGNRVVDGSITDRIAALRGTPVVVNQWASWCPNCKAEFGFFQQAARQHRRDVAFLGLDSQDSRGDAQAFLASHPVPYPSVFDQSASQALSLGGGQGWPTTIYVDAAGRRTYVRQGGYTTLASLETDIQRYALAR